uniref:Phosphatidate cytidylyltransferase, mitochondrial n=1 Tax=Sexangularia sp. CB-2014 TaxID=1486929 RepID=A0A7S1VR45_9EUKA
MYPLPAFVQVHPFPSLLNSLVVRSIFKMSPLLVTTPALTNLIVKSLPTATVGNLCMGIGYGSGVVGQAGGTRGGMVDLLLVSSESSDLVRAIAQPGVVQEQLWRQWNERVMHFSPFLEWQGTSVKVGIVSEHLAIRDATNWHFLSFAGRMHKPTVEAVRCHSAPLAAALHANLVGALSLALLRQPLSQRHVAWSTLVPDLVRLSYDGDIRRTLGAERADKVTAIAGPQASLFPAYYADAVRTLGLRPHRWTVEREAVGEVAAARAHLVQLLNHIPIAPAGWRARVAWCNTLEEVEQVRQTTVETMLATARRRVRLSSTRQLVYSTFSVGPAKSLRYALEKLKKGVLSGMVRG